MDIASTELPAPFSFKVGMKLSDDGDLLSPIFRDHYGEAPRLEDLFVSFSPNQLDLRVNNTFPHLPQVF